MLFGNANKLAMTSHVPHSAPNWKFSGWANQPNLQREANPRWHSNENFVFVSKFLRLSFNGGG